MSNGEGQYEAGSPAALVAVLVVVLNDLNQRQLRHLQGAASEVVSVGAAEVSATEAVVALEVAVGDSALVAEASEVTEVVSVATAMVMIVEDTVIEVDLAAIVVVSAVVSMVAVMVV